MHTTKKTIIVLIVGLLMLLSSCAALLITNASSELAAETPLITDASGVPHIPYESSSSSLTSGSEKGLYTMVTINDFLVGLTLPGSDKACGLAVISRHEDFMQLAVTLHDGSRLIKLFNNNYISESGDLIIFDGITLSAGDVDNDGYDELIVFLLVAGSNYGAGTPVVIKVVDCNLVEMSSAVEYQRICKRFPEPNPDLINGAIAIEKGVLRLMEETGHNTDGECLSRCFDMRYENDTWIVFSSGVFDFDEYAFNNIWVYRWTEWNSGEPALCPIV